MTYRPLSKRGVADPDLDTLHEGVPRWMREPLCDWLADFLYARGYSAAVSNIDLIKSVEMELRLPPFSRQYNIAAADAALDLVRSNETFALELVDYILQHIDVGRESWTALVLILMRSGSIWSISRVDADPPSRFWMLTRRDLDGAKLAISDIRTASQHAGAFLSESWKAIATRDPDATKGYDNAVWAIEAAAQPVVSPANTRATLGTVIHDMRAKTDKWTFALGDLGLVIDMADRIWTEQFRHGTQERAQHSLFEADAALHMAIPLVRYFVGGLVARAS
jgi:hypothetical protein